MSDGNFNRALLPSTPYASGLKMGRQQMRVKATSAFAKLIEKEFPERSPQEMLELCDRFSQMLR